MHGLIPAAIQRFLVVTYGGAIWAEIADKAAVPDGGFEAMLSYPENVVDHTLAAAAERLEKDQASLLEDLGIFLISHPDVPALRRLLRFCGASFSDFLNGLEDLSDRAHLAVPGLDVPSLELNPLGGKRYRIEYVWHRADGIHVVAGVLRAMADDYGVLAFSEIKMTEEGRPYLEVSILEREFAAGREFDLGASA